MTEMESPFEHVYTVTIELSNLCGCSWFHKRCPLHLEMESPFLMEPRVLPGKIVRQVLKELSQYDYGGRISFTVYNEPMEDPRLFWFIRCAKRLCPRSYIYMYTNGRFFDQNIANELAEMGVEWLMVTRYGTPEEQAIMQKHIATIKGNVSPGILIRTLGRRKLDARLVLYDGKEFGDIRGCYAHKYIYITRDAEVALCGWEWKREHVFGSLYEQTLEDIVRSDKWRETHERLVAGDRVFDICKRCQRPRLDQEQCPAGRLKMGENGNAL